MNIPQESASGCKEFLQEIKCRGVGKVYSSSMQQDCTLHFQRNINKHIRKSDREEFCSELKAVFNPDDVFHTPENGLTELKTALAKWSKNHPRFNSIIKSDR